LEEEGSVVERSNQRQGGDKDGDNLWQQQRQQQAQRRRGSAQLDGGMALNSSQLLGFWDEDRQQVFLSAVEGA